MSREIGKIYLEIADRLVEVRRPDDPGRVESVAASWIFDRLTPTAVLYQTFPGRISGTPYNALVQADAMPERILLIASCPEVTRERGIQEVALALMDNMILRDERP